MAKNLLRTIFCANDQVEVAHVLGVSPQGEVTATCSNCERVVKFPKGITPEEFEDAIVSHKANNEGQVTHEAVDILLHQLADDEVEDKKIKPI